MRRARFRGRIAGTGTTNGVRVVVGRWTGTPLGAFADVMVETTDGHRVLLAPTREVADFVATTYTFDEVRTEPVDVAVTTRPDGGRWVVTCPSLDLDLTAPTDAHAVVAAGGRFDGVDLGTIAPVDPPCRFGFGSTPRRPSVTTLVTTVDVPSGQPMW